MGHNVEKFVCYIGFSFTNQADFYLKKIRFENGTKTQLAS